MTATDEGSVPETAPPVELPGPGSKRPALASSERTTDVLLGVVIAVSTGFYLALSRSLWFYSDDWAFLLRRGTVTEDVDAGRLGLWEPHNEHWSTGPILIYRALFEVFGLRHYTPYLVPVLLAHVALVLLAYRLLIRFGVRRWVAFAVATMLAFNGAGAENILWPFQIGFVGALALGFGALWLYDRYDVSGWRALANLGGVDSGADVLVHGCGDGRPGQRLCVLPSGGPRCGAGRVGAGRRVTPSGSPPSAGAASARLRRSGSPGRC